MIVLALFLIVGLLIGRKCQTKLLIVASFAVLCVSVSTAFSHGIFTIIDVLLMFSRLSALQGGFLIGAYFQTRRVEKGFG